MKTSTKLLASLVLSSSLIFTGVMAADHEKKGNHQGFKIERLTKKLSLTEAQVISIQALVDEKKANKVAKVKPTKEERKAKKLAMKEKFKAMMETSEFDESGVRAEMAERTNKHTERQIGKMRLQHDIYQVLNEEQREDYLKMMAKKHKKMSKKHKKNMKKKRAEKAEKSAE